MTLDVADRPSSEADWLFAIGEGRAFPNVDGLVAVEGYDPLGRAPEEVDVMERSRDYGARAVFFEAASVWPCSRAPSLCIRYTRRD